MDDSIDLKLPKSNKHEDLETISASKFRLLLDPKQFEVRSETVRDKGVDLIIELKHHDCYTNFRFVVQLKATITTAFNADGSISYPAAVSNINYLMNYAMPAYYVLYEANSDSFYYEDSQVVNERLQNKYSQKELPDEFSIRFQHILTVQALKDIYDENYKKGQLIRKMKPFMRFNLENRNLTGSFTVNENQEVYSDDDIIGYIEKYGVLLINKGYFRKVADLQQKCRAETGSPFYHFVCGLAYYHLSQLFTALSHLKKAEAGKAELQPEIASLLYYYMQTAKYTLGMISRDEFQSLIGQVMASKYLSLFLQVGKSYEDFVMGTEDLAEKTRCFYETMAAIKNDPDSDDNLKIIVDAQTLVVEGDILNNDLHRKLALMRVIPGGSFLLSDEMQQWLSLNNDYDKQTHHLREAAIAQENYLAYNIICINNIKTRYSTSVTTKYIRNLNEKTFYVDTEMDEDELNVIDEQCKLLDQIIHNYEVNESIENVVATLSLKYELLKYSGRNSEADLEAKRMIDLIDAYDLLAFKAKYKVLINGGTTHELFLAYLKQRLLNMQEETKEFDLLKKKMKGMDKMEATAGRVTMGDTCQIHLIPLGYFMVPEPEFEQALDIIHVTDPNIKRQFVEMCKMGIMPIANVNNDPVLREGHANGVADFKGLESIRNVYRIREAFYNRKFYKISH